MFYIVYKTTNQVNGKFYIGTHKTVDLNDDYLGSGTLLKRAIQKYGVENFKKEILFVFDNPEDMFAKEAEIVTEEFLSENNAYNLKKGGFGGWDYCNGSLRDYVTDKSKKYYSEKMRSEEFKKSLTERIKPYHGLNDAFVEGRKNSKRFLGRQHSTETKNKIGERNSILLRGNKNPSYGKEWINNGKKSIMVQKGSKYPEGYTKGRIIVRDNGTVG